MGIFLVGGHEPPYSHSKGLYKDPNDCANHPNYLDHLRHVRDIFGTIRVLKIICCDQTFENLRLKMSKNTFLPYCEWIRAFTTFFKLRNEKFRLLRSEYMTIRISQLFKLGTQKTSKVASFQRSLDPKLVEILKN